VTNAIARRSARAWECGASTRLSSESYRSIPRSSRDATAYFYRDATHNLVARASWDDRKYAEARTAWQKATWAGVVPFTKGFYSNLAPQAKAPPGASFGANFARLQAIKKQYDPTNLLHMNQNITPAA
jgi:FAD/FMN-containing dehydrogenase